MNIELPLSSGWYDSQSKPFSAQRLINYYVNIAEEQSLSASNLYGTPGIEQIATTGISLQVNRGAHVKNGLPYFVNGETLYRLNRQVDIFGNESFDAESLGVVSGTERVSMSDNGTQLIILVPGGNGYIYNENDVTPFQQITDPDFTANGNPRYVVFVDGYFLVTTDDKKFIISAINDGLSWNALDFASAEYDPDGIVAPAIFRNQVMILGEETTESFRNVPSGAGFPFIRSNLFLDKGCFAPNALVRANDTYFMLGGGVNESPAIWQFTGNNYQKISTTPIEFRLAAFSREEVLEAFGFQYTENGAYFVGFTVADFTIVYDFKSGKWHERISVVDEASTRWRVNSLVTAYGRVLVGDSVDGRIGVLSSDNYMEYGNSIIREFVTQPFSNLGKSVRVSKVEIMCEMGAGNGSEDDPQISMSISDDGKNFKDERRRSIGRIGEYSKRAIWYRNGITPYFRSFKFLFSDPVKPVVNKLIASYY